MTEQAQAEAAVTVVREDRAYKKVFWHLMPFLMLCFVVSFLNRTNIGIAKLDFSRQLGFSEAVYGFGAGIFFLGNIFFEIPSQLYLVRIGVRPTLMRIMVIWGFVSAAMAFMHTATHFYLLRFLLGAAEAGFQPGVLFYLTLWIPSSRRARVTAFFMASIPISGIVGGPLAGSIMHALPHWHGLQGWQWLFILEGLPAALLGISAYYFLDDGPAHASWLAADEKALVIADLDRDRVPKTGHSVHERLGAAFKDPRLYIAAVLGVALTISTSSIYLWLPTIIHETGVRGILLIGVLSAVPFLVGFIAQFYVAKSSDHFGERRWHSALPAFAAVIGWLLLPHWAGDPVIAMILITLAAAGTMGAMGPYWTLPTIFLSGPASAVGLAVILLFANLGAFFSQSVVGWLAGRTGNLNIGMYYFGATMLLGGIATLLLKLPSSKRPDA